MAIEGSLFLAFVGLGGIYFLSRALYFRRHRRKAALSEAILYTGPVGADQALRGGGGWQWVTWVRTTLTIYANHVAIIAPQGWLASRRDILLSSETATMRLDRHGPMGLPLARRTHIRLVGCNERGEREEFMLAPKDGLDSAWQALLRSGVKPLPPAEESGEYYGASLRVRAAQAVWTGIWAAGVFVPTWLRQWEPEDRSGPVFFMLLFLLWMAGAHLLAWLGERSGSSAQTTTPLPTPELGRLHLTVALVFIAGMAFWPGLTN